jgi:alpha-galactosidase
VQAHRIRRQGQLEIWARPLADGSQAVGLFNRGESPSPITLDLKSIGITHAAKIRDLWKHQNESAAGSSFTAHVPAHGVVLLKAY